MKYTVKCCNKYISLGQAAQNCGLPYCFIWPSQWSYYSKYRLWPYRMQN